MKSDQLEGQQRERTHIKRQRRKANKEHQVRVASQTPGKKILKGLVVSGVNIGAKSEKD